MSTIFCENCGATIEEGAKFCNTCGKLTNVSPIPASDFSTTNQTSVNSSSSYMDSTSQQPTSNINSTPNSNSNSSTSQQAYSNPSSYSGLPYQQPTINANSQPNYGYNPQSYGSQPNQAYYPQQNAYQNSQNNAPMTVGDYIGTILLCAIPIAGLILLFIWAFSSDTNINKKNYAKAYLILMAIGTGIYIFFIIIGVAIGTSIGNY